MVIIKSVVFLLLIQFALSATIESYCNLPSCKGRQHIACLYNGTWAPTCPKDAKLVTLTPAHKTFIVNTHNSLRNRIALGNQNGFKSATRMATMIWDEELATVASYNVKQCTMKHDDCRTTATLNIPGQNLAINWSPGTFVNVQTFLNSSVVRMWYGEVVDARQPDVDKCCSSTTGKPIGHFTQMVSDSSIAVGCAYAQFSTDSKIKTSLMACNYARTNMGNTPVYKSGKTASGCKTGKNIKYAGLCSASEKIDPNTGL